MKLQINELLALQAIDSEIGRLQQEQAALDRGERVERALAIRRARLEKAEMQLKGLEIEQRSAEMELKSLEEKKHTESQRLYAGRITAPRELQALEAEIHMLERQRQRLDEQILRRGDEIETAQKAVDAAQAVVEEAEKALGIITRRYEKEQSRIESRMKERLPSREQLAAKVDPEVLKRYDQIRRRTHNIGAVRVENGACGGCRMKVGMALLRRMMVNEQYVYCESCSRFLFPPEED